MHSIQWKNVFSTTALSAILIVANLSVASCGGSKGGGSPPTVPPTGTVPPTVPPSPPPPPTPPPTATTWQKDYYLPRSTYMNRCQFVRTGTQPGTNTPYNDVRGSMLEELFYLRSLTRETYLFRSDLTDFDPSPYNKVQATFAAHSEKMEEYFQELKTKELTASNNPKDRFHFTYPTAEYLVLTLNIAQPSYGISWVNLGGTEVRDGRTYVKIPRDYRVRFVLPDSPAAEVIAGSPKVKRGDKLLKVNGVDFLRSNNTSALNLAFGAPTGTSTTFVLSDVDSGQEKTVVIKPKEITQKPVNKATILEVGEEKVGYVHYTTFFTKDSDSTIHNAIKDFKSKGVTDLVLDLRYNGGGYTYVSSMLGYMIAGKSRTRGKIFSKDRYHEGAGNRNPVTGDIEPPLGFIDAGLGGPYFSIPRGTALESLNLGKVYILSTEDTCSASEGLINGLVGIDVEVILIGGTTCGKPYGFYGEDNCGITYFTIQVQSENHKGFGEYGDGFVPSTVAEGAKLKGCTVADDFTKQLGDSAEALLAAALKYRKDGTCPPSPSPPSPPSTVDVIASSEGMASEYTPRSELEVPEDPYYFDARILTPRN